MASGRLFLAVTLGLSSCAALPAVLRAEDAAPAEAEGKHVFQGEVNANSVFVRSRGSEDAYPTMKLNKGEKVTVVGIRGQWLKIEPPDGSFAYVAKSFINLRGDGTIGRATRDTLAHAGSQLNQMAAVTIATVHEGDDVQILGQYNEYFKIKPPTGSFLYVNKQFVDPLKTVSPDEVATHNKAGNEADTNRGPAESPATPEAPMAEHPAFADRTPTTRPAGDAAVAQGGSPASPPSTQPAFDPVVEYGKLEQQFLALSAKPLGEQPLPELLAGYQKVLASDELPSSMRSIAEIRMSTLKGRNEAREKYLTLEENQKKMTAQRQALAAERQEIEDRIKKNDVQVYAAVGTLRPSSLQVGQGMLYRLTDPATGRTVCYVRTNDSKFETYLGQFIGIRGTVNVDPQLKSIIENPAEAKEVDQAQVNGSIAAQIVPPSLMHYTPPAAPAAPSSPAPTAAAPTGPAVVAPAPASNATGDQASTAPEPQ
jgi:SH3-like domain-containing protein